MKTAALIFPHQLFDKHPALGDSPHRIYLVEDALFFGDEHHRAEFHQQKLWLHRATMTRYADRLREAGRDPVYVDYLDDQRPLQRAIEQLVDDGAGEIVVAEPHDYILMRRLRRFAKRRSLHLRIVDTPCFLNTAEQNASYRAGKKRWYMADFYQHQRRRLDVLMDGDQPVGERWSFDEDNRKKVPKRRLKDIPSLPTVSPDDYDRKAQSYVRDHFHDHPGTLDELIYPTSHERASVWLQEFLDQRLALFGDYEDAIVQDQSWLWHAVLTPMLNIGLLTPEQVVQTTLEHAATHSIPLNSLEGFVRQIIGWREFIRATYDDLHVKMRRTNHWGHHRRIPKSFWDATTDIDPVDDCIRRVHRTGYLHHIERLMVMGGFMFLCEFDPDEIYQWFMDLFIDSYDWVMVPNAYAMSQNADGGLITTKPYFSGSAYIKKMSHHRHDRWADIWDGLYWRWIWNHREELGKNPRWAMMCKMAERMDETKRRAHLRHAEQYLQKLDEEGPYYN